MDNPENDTVNPALAGNVGYDILLVKNTYVNQRIALMILTEYGLGLDAFKDHALQNKPFDVILMKVSMPMPLMDGMDAAQRIRAYKMQ